MFKCGSGHRQVETLIADSLRQTAPAACHGDIDRENPALLGAQNPVESNPEARCERRIELPLSFDPSFVSPIVTALTKRWREDTLPIH
jgi:hypothetical protein